ncbi:hypothetical protein CLOP_g25728 [Closterium sp. NIES-67]|nr:hypothetical protein CLOP_g25728 [Closterium sp. NIES-67]
MQRLEAGLIRPSNSPYAATTVVAAQTDLTGEVLARRMCGDYRELNRVTRADRYSMPTAEEIFDRLEGAVIFSTLDMRQGFNQIAIKGGDKGKTAFHGADGLYEWNMMPFGLRNASAVFQRVMDQVLKTVPAVACYIDDVVIFSKSEEEHAEHLKATLDAIADAGLTCHPEKCKIARKTVAYLGFEVQGGKMGIQEAKVAVLDKLGTPKDKGALRALLGFLNYYRRFIPNFSKRAYRLNQLLREEQAWKWGSEEEQARRDLLEAIKAGTVLQLPKKDAPFTIYTDWSSMGMGAVLCQELEGEERVVAYTSRSCTATEANYSSYEGEGLGAVWGVTHFRAYLQGRKFTLVTDHQPLLWLMTNQTLMGWNARWAMRLQEYDLAQEAKEQRLGHYGGARTRQLLQTTYWWTGMRRDVAQWVQGCEACERNKAALEKGREELQSLPIRGLGFRWSLDLAGELPLSRREKMYIVVMIEHMTKWVEARAIASKNSGLIREAILDQVLTRYGACGEVLTDQGTEFQGSFAELLKEAGITHRVTSRYHPQSDGLIERMIHTIKKGLRVYREQKKREWDTELPWVLAGYRFAKRSALKDMSPYHLLYGRELVLPVDI